MWTANAIKETGPNGSRVIAIVYASDSGYAAVREVFEVTEGTTQDFLNQRANERITKLSSQDAAYESLQDGPLSPKASPPPSQDELDKQQYFLDLQILQQLSAAVASGIIAKDDPSIAAQQTKVKAEFKPEYVGL